MILECKDKELEDLINFRYVGKYKSYKSNAKLIRDLIKVINHLRYATDINEVARVNGLAYEALKNSPYSSVRVGYKTKYRLIFEVKEDKITLLLIELSEHYGDH